MNIFNKQEGLHNEGSGASSKGFRIYTNSITAPGDNSYPSILHFGSPNNSVMSFSAQIYFFFSRTPGSGNLQETWQRKYRGVWHNNSDGSWSEDNVTEEWGESNFLGQTFIWANWNGNGIDIFTQCGSTTYVNVVVYASCTNWSAVNVTYY